MKKIVYMITTLFYPSIGGVENHVYNLSKELVKRDIIVKVINPVINLGKNDIYDLEGIEVHKITVGNNEDEQKYLKYKSKSKQNLFGFFNGYKRKCYYNKFSNDVYEYILKDTELERPDKFILHQHDFISSIKLSKKLSKKYNIIFTNHTGEFLFLKKLPFSNLIIKKLTNHFKFIIAPSNELADFKGIRKENTYSFLSNGVDVEKFSPVTQIEKNNLRDKYNIPKNKVVVICPRRWAPTKGVIYLVKAIDILINRYNIHNISFVFAGNDYLDYPEYRDEILDIIKNKSLIEYVYLQGNIDYKIMNELIKMSDIVAIPSLMEAISLSALEGMACGKIIIGTNVGGFPQIIQNTETGFLVEPEDEEKLAQIIKDVSSGVYNNIKICEKAREFVEVKYSWSFICSNTINIYDKSWN
ncbi:glycosyltransferase family 4 protein [Clostridium sporogenes]|uniref:glycosyltransferase family 4 protein n=1 Tax=Clostridium sporogenes TaxID=1509 RepID=UPI0013C75AE6|nr:glycosyltransferase family 4 protein [Clostridium sporogenes]NFF65037.1 glycosyltransferase family 4 protein [Clostridium sporogenes]